MPLSLLYIVHTQHTISGREGKLFLILSWMLKFNYLSVEIPGSSYEKPVHILTFIHNSIHTYIQKHSITFSGWNEYCCNKNAISSVIRKCCNNYFSTVSVVVSFIHVHVWISEFLLPTLLYKCTNLSFSLMYQNRFSKDSFTEGMCYNIHNK